MLARGERYRAADGNPAPGQRAHSQLSACDGAARFGLADPERFAQIHRSVIVALAQVVQLAQVLQLAQVAQVTRGANETADIHLRGRTEVLPVSRSFVHLFRQM